MPMSGEAKKKRLPKLVRQSRGLDWNPWLLDWRLITEWKRSDVGNC